MIISHKYRFIFIKTIKTAGTSIEAYLAPHCGPGDVLTPIYPPVEGHTPRNHAGVFNPFPELTAAYIGQPRYPSRLGVLKQCLTMKRYFNHMPAVSARARVGAKVWDSYFKFCVERNPFEKMISFYYMQKKRGFVTDVEDFFQKGRLPRDWERYCDFNGGLMVDRILRYEELNAELGSVFEQLGVPYGGTLTAKAKTNYRTPSETYHSLFNAEQRARLEARFSREMETFGYTWDGDV